jgi:TRAP-type mannitol/chloroaromatic compound transport system permease small subunit
MDSEIPFFSAGIGSSTISNSLVLSAMMNVGMNNDLLKNFNNFLEAYWLDKRNVMFGAVVFDEIAFLYAR